jgi:homoserine O-acetyltransferase
MDSRLNVKQFLKFLVLAMLVSVLVSCVSSQKFAYATKPAKPVTAQANFPQYLELKKTVTIPNFKIGGEYAIGNPASYENGGMGGKTLESLGQKPLEVSYIATGTPQRNAKGEIINAVIVNSYYSGGSTSSYFFWHDHGDNRVLVSKPIVGPGLLIDTNKYYVIYLDALGLWGTSKPSQGLGMKFPQYGFQDMVQANYRLLKDHLKVGKVAISTGVSMGATQTYLWGLMHPEFVEAIMPIGGTTQFDGFSDWMFKLSTSGIKSDPVWQKTKGAYYHLPKEKHPNRGVMFGWSVIAHTGFDFDFTSSLPAEAVNPKIFNWDDSDETLSWCAGKAKAYDANDLIYRNNAGNNFDINKHLPNMKAKTLVIHVKNDQWLNINLAERSAKAIPWARISTFEDKLAHYAVFNAPNIMEDDIRLFLDEIQATGKSKIYNLAESSYRTPEIKMDESAGPSHWIDQVVYPFDVKYAACKDTQNRTWMTGYMDEYIGEDKNPDVFVLIHGKGANAGHYGYVMKYALMNGLRVIAVDLPHYGKSSPFNTAKSEARTLEDCRAVLHDLVVKQLGVKQAYYHGHSLGGQVSLGYALTYPNAVKGLILEAPAGIEPIPCRHGALVDPSYYQDFDQWMEIWGNTGILDKELAKTPEDIELFYYFKKLNDAGEIVPAGAGYFMKDTEYARLLTDQRIAIIDDNPADGWEEEFWHHIVAFVYDVYSMASEGRLCDDSSLFNNLEKIKCPIFLQFGNDEPFIPLTAISGLTDRDSQVVKPFMDRMLKVGNKVVYKGYKDSGHFIHTDHPYEYSKDCVEFITTGKVEGAFVGVAPESKPASDEGAPQKKKGKKGAFSK